MSLRYSTIAMLSAMAAIRQYFALLQNNSSWLNSAKF